MNKKDVQKRVLYKGNNVSLDDFEWDEKTKTFSSGLSFLIIGFNGIDICTFKTGSNCTFKTGYDCTFDTGSGCTFDTSYDCTFDAGYGCTFDTSSNCTFKTGSNCTFKTGYDCTFDTGHGCTFDTGYDCVVVRRDIFECIKLKKDTIYQLCPIGILGFLENGMYNGEPHVIVDGILSKIVSKKRNIYKVINHGEEDSSFLVNNGGIWSHGKTIKEAQDSLVYKLKDRDASAYESMTVNDVLSKNECIKMYRTITGACESGVKYFVENQEETKEKYTIQEIIDKTFGQYGHKELKQFFKVA